MSVLARPLTYDDLQDMPQDGQRYEIIDGELIVTTAAVPKHQIVSHRLAVACDRGIVEPGIGQVFEAPLDVRLSAHDTVQPDLLAIRRERLHIVGEKSIEGAPDLVVEILSPSTRGYDQVRKAALYTRSGVPEFWIVDPDRRRVTVFALANGRYEEVPQEAGRVRSIVFPELTVELDWLFAGLG